MRQGEEVASRCSQIVGVVDGWAADDRQESHLLFIESQTPYTEIKDHRTVTIRLAVHRKGNHREATDGLRWRNLIAGWARTRFVIGPPSLDDRRKLRAQVCDVERFLADDSRYGVRGRRAIPAEGV